MADLTPLFDPFVLPPVFFCSCCRARAIVGELPQNTPVIKLVRKLGFDVSQNPADDTMHLRLPL